jgi:UDP-glucose 4-epimerase
MKVLITGGAGFIGSHVADACIANGDTVCIIDDLSTGSLENISHLMGHRQFRSVVGSILDVPLVTRLVDESDVVYHVAAVVGMMRVVEQPLATYRTNVYGTQVVLDAAAARRKRTLFISTSEVYGLNPMLPTAETEVAMLGSTAKNRWSYAYSKAAGEVLSMAYYHEQHAPVVVTRLFNTVGPRQTGRYGMVIPRFVRQALAGKPLTVYGDGMQTRSFADVREIAQGIVKLMGHALAAGEIFNLGNPSEISILDLARRVIELTGSRSRIEFVPFDVAYEPGFEEIMRRVPDVRKAQQLIDFRPQIGIDTILSSVITEQKQRLVAV